MRYFLLPGLGLALCCAAGAVVFAPRAPAPGSRLACPALAPHLAAADRIEIARGGEVFWLERRGTVWGLARQGGFPARAGAPEALLQALQGVELLTKAPGSPTSEGTIVRVLAQSGGTLCSLVVLQPTVLRRAAERDGWLASAKVKVDADPADWSRTSLPPLDPGEVTALVSDGRLAKGPLEQALASLPVTDVRARPQIRAQPIRRVEMTLRDGTAVLTVGVLDHQSWLTVSGSAAWAQALAPYAFALPSDSVLATM